LPDASSCIPDARSIGYFAWGCFQCLAGFTSSNNLKELYPITGRIGYLWSPQLVADHI
jgi:hypothetical protein